jgi:hypothetical protein
MKVHASTHYVVENWGADGKLRWVAEAKNLVMTAGLNKLLDAAFKTGLAAPAWYIGLVDGQAPEFAAADTPDSHVGWVEFDDYSDSTRQALVPGTISGGSVDNTASRAVFHVTGIGSNDRHVAGLFLTDDDTIDGANAAKVLYGAAVFSGGERPVNDGDILRVATNLQISAE